MDYQIKNILFLVFSSLIFWISLVIYRERVGKDILFLRRVFSPTRCNGWCFLHFIHYTLLSYFAPDYWFYLILMGIIFELIEIPLNNVSKYIDSKLVEDTITNTLGVIFGMALFKIFPHKIDILKEAQIIPYPVNV
tara:strand:+ start:5427 stop:5834 length:408 start_codon:yes stop_codon:yes gene_type:complete